MTVRVGVTGALGRMGGEVLAEANSRETVEVAFAVDRSVADGDEAATAGPVAVQSSEAFDALLGDRRPDVVVDFTGPSSTVDYARRCADAGVAFVTGTTGLDDDQLAALREASESTPVLKAPNFARGVQALLNVVGEAVRSLPGYDVEVVETHHNQKRDAPSGTANRLLDEIEAHGDFSGRKHGREGFDPREEGEIGVHVLRAGNVTGEHEIVIAGNHEEVRLTHRAEDRGVFAAGAVDAATWIAGRKAGWYEFADVIDQ